MLKVVDGEATPARIDIHVEYRALMVHARRAAEGMRAKGRHEDAASLTRLGDRLASALRTREGP